MVPFVSFWICYLFWSHFEITTNISGSFIARLCTYIKKQKAWSFIFQIIFLTIFWFLINIHIFMAWVMTELLLIFSQNVDIIGCQMKWCLTFHLNWIVERKVYFCLRVCDIHERTKIMVVHFKTRWYRFDFWNLETEKKKSNPYSSRHKIIFCWTSQINVGIFTL